MTFANQDENNDEEAADVTVETGLEADGEGADAEEGDSDKSDGECESDKADAEEDDSDKSDGECDSDKADAEEDDSDKSDGECDSDKPDGECDSDKPEGECESDKPEGECDSDKPEGECDSDKAEGECDSDKPEEAPESCGDGCGCEDAVGDDAADAVGDFPVASLEMLLMTHHTQAVMALGMMPDPMSGETSANKHAAKFHIDMLSVIEEKTKGNLTSEESESLSSILHQLRMAFFAS